MAMMLIDQTKDSACKTAEADAIRAKTGGSAQLAYDWANNKGFADAIAAIPSGGGGIKLLASGTYAMTSTSPDMYIPVSYSGTPVCAFVVNYNPSAGVTQALCWFVPCLPAIAESTVSGYFTGKDLSVAKRLYANGTANYVFSFTPTEVTETQIHVRRAGASGYDPVPGTYNWYIWGFSS